MALREIKQILDFWFAEAHRPFWFKKEAAFDDEIRRRFEPAHEAAAAGSFSAWQNTPEGALALLICLDQFPRNMYRGTPRAFATDAKARAVADWAVDREFDLRFKTDDERMFFYLPFEHSEEIDDQHRCVELVRTRCTDPEFLRYAVAHRDVIARFGRFPHRNAILGRPNTPEEEEYLKQPGAGF
ncbi:MAG: DUF924 domain-containing protein [Rhodospirillaceae bacterium]|nr:DUF924 domain-containing protein [Rhodospirillaceae bacterium]